MRFHNVAQDLAGSRARIEILKTLVKYPGKIFTGREAALISGVSKTRTAELLSAMEKNNIVHRRKIGAACGWTANMDSILVTLFMRDIAALDKKVMDDLKGELRNRFGGMAEVSKIVLFGSVARGDEAPDSDIDLLVLLKSGEKRREALKKADEMNLFSVARYGNPLSSHIYTESEYEKNGGGAELKKRIAEEGMVIVER